MKRFFLLVFGLVLSFQIVAQNQFRITSADINLRKNPWIDKNVICIIPKSTSVTVDYSNQQFSDWIQINYKGNVGYVSSKYLENQRVKSAFSNSNCEILNSSSTVKYYKNSNGEKVQSPTYYKTAPAGATAECRDGTYSFSRNRRGTCSHHGGVKRWL